MSKPRTIFDVASLYFKLFIASVGVFGLGGLLFLLTFAVSSTVLVVFGAIFLFGGAYGAFMTYFLYMKKRIACNIYSEITEKNNLTFEQIGTEYGYSDQLISATAEYMIKENFLLGYELGPDRVVRTGMKSETATIEGEESAGTLEGICQTCGEVNFFNGHNVCPSCGGPISAVRRRSKTVQ